METNTNKWIGEGKITTEIVLRTTPNNYNVVNFILKINDSYKVKDEISNSSNYKCWQEKITYIPIVAWGEEATGLSLKYKRHDSVRVIGRLNRCNIKDIEKHNGFEIVMEDISMIEQS